MSIRILFVVFCVLNLADLFITLIILDKWGVEMELNPIARLLAENSSIYVALPILKLVAIGAGYILYYNNYQKLIIVFNLYIAFGVICGLDCFL